MHLFILVFAALLNWAGAAEITIGQDTPVYQSASDEARILLTLHAGETIETQPAKNPEFYRIRVKRGNKWRAGFVLKDSLDLGVSHSVPAHKWGFGLSYMAGSLSQKGKSFSTMDQVQYTTSDFKGFSGSPMVTVQWKSEDFWRLGVGQKSTRATSTATTSVGVSNEMLLKLSFWSVVLQKAWTPFSTKNIYFGIGGELAKTYKMELLYGSTTLKTTSEDYPVYAGGEIFAGFSTFLNSSFSLYAEGRIQHVFSQSPAIQFLEAGAGISYWP